MKLPQLTLRDLFWLVALAAVGCGWWVHASHGPSRDTYYRAWGFEIATDRLRERTGDVMTVDQDGVLIQSDSGNHTERFSFGDGYLP